jgi:hypothetical protein
MTKTMSNVPEHSLELVIDTQERDGWDFITATQSSAASFFGEINRSFPATYLLFFRKRVEQHNDIP